MTDIVARLRESVKACRALDRSALLEEAATVIERLRMTDEEREALHHVVGDVADITGPVEDTIRGLLERTK